MKKLCNHLNSKWMQVLDYCAGIFGVLYGVYLLCDNNLMWGLVCVVSGFIGCFFAWKRPSKMIENYITNRNNKNI